MNEHETELLTAIARVVAAFATLGVEYLLGVLKVQAAALDRNYLIKAQPARFRGA